MRRDRGRLAKFAVTLLGEVVQSGFHFALNIMLVRSLSQHDYGVFAIAFLAGGIALTYVRALAGVPISTFLPAQRHRRAGRAIEVTFGSGALIVSAAFGLGFAGFLLITDTVNPLAGGAFVALWCLRSYLRLALYAKNLTAFATACDIAFAASGIALAFLLVRGDDAARTDGVFVALACAHAIGVATALVALREPIRVSFKASSWGRYHAIRRQLGWSLIGVTTTNLQGQGQTLAMALMLGPDAYAPIAAALILFAPLRLAAAALINMTQPEMGAQVGRADRSGAARLASRTAGALLLLCLAYGLVLLVSLPAIATHFFAARFPRDEFGLIVLALWAVVTVSLTYAPLRVLLELTQEYRFLAKLSAIAAAAGLLTVCLLLLSTPPAWSLLGLLLSEVVILLGCLAAMRPSAGPAPAVGLRARYSPPVPR
jgi:O-antigen/teichoic acid export membrane protein